MHSLGTKIVVVGVSASGKSMFARKLKAHTGLPITHMDSIWWKPGWTEVEEQEASARIKNIGSNDSWIIEGYIPESARVFLFERADTIFYLNYSRVVSSWRYIKRWWRHRKNPRPELEGSPEKFSFKFLRLVWNKGEAISLNKDLSEIKDRSKIITLYSPAKAAEFLRG